VGDDHDPDVGPGRVILGDRDPADPKNSDQSNAEECDPPKRSMHRAFLSTLKATHIDIDAGSLGRPGGGPGLN
jgi:hypothetical protein